MEREQQVQLFRTVVEMISAVSRRARPQNATEVEVGVTLEQTRGRPGDLVDGDRRDHVTAWKERMKNLCFEAFETILTDLFSIESLVCVLQVDKPVRNSDDLFDGLIANLGLDIGRIPAQK